MLSLTSLSGLTLLLCAGMVLALRSYFVKQAECAGGPDTEIVYSANARLCLLGTILLAVPGFGALIWGFVT